uniref:Uncharacterized protein n=1 Tax=Romanomermis culicivorax TaxID=13658 RepID=A0A915KSY9_ROMCU
MTISIEVMRQYFGRNPSGGTKTDSQVEETKAEESDQLLQTGPHQTACSSLEVTELTEPILCVTKA